jgi:hypothetical protein
LRLAAPAVVAPGQAVRLEQPAQLRAGKVEAPLELAVARPVRAVAPPERVAAKLERRAELRAGKVGARPGLAAAQLGLAAAQLERLAAPPVPAVHLEPRALKQGGVAIVGGAGSPPGRRSLHTGKGKGRVGRGAAIEAWGAPGGAASPGEVADFVDAFRRAAGGEADRVTSIRVKG